jgi:hypothetical protein
MKILGHCWLMLKTNKATKMDEVLMGALLTILECELHNKSLLNHNIIILFTKHDDI